MFLRVVGVKVGVVNVGAPPLLLLLVLPLPIPGLPVPLVPLELGKMSRLDLGVPGVLSSTTGVWSSPLDWLNVRSAGPGKAPPPASRPSLKFSLATVCGSFEMDPSLELSLFSTGCWSFPPSWTPSPSLRVSLDSDSEGEVALSASVAISIEGEPESLYRGS